MSSPECDPAAVLAANPDHRDIVIQAMIAGRFSDEGTRIAWLEANGARFRELLEHDDEFSRLVETGDVDGVVSYLEKDQGKGE